VSRHLTLTIFLSTLRCLSDCGAPVLLLSSVRLVWYSLSGFSVLLKILQTWQSCLANLYYLFFQLDQLWGSTLC